MTQNLASSENFDIVRGNVTVRVPFPQTEPSSAETDTLVTTTYRTTSLSEQSTDEQYPSAKCVYDQLQLRMKPYPFENPEFTQTGDKWTFSGRTTPPAGKSFRLVSDIYNGTHFWILFILDSEHMAYTDAQIMEAAERGESWAYMLADKEGGTPMDSHVEFTGQINVTAERSWVCNLSPFTSAQVDMASSAMSGITEFKVVVSASPVANAMRETIFVIKTESTAPTVEWDSSIDRFDGGSPSYAAPAASATNVYSIFEYVSGRFAVEKQGTHMLANAPISGATKCKITYDRNGLVTSGADLTEDDIPTLTTAKLSDFTTEKNLKADSTSIAPAFSPSSTYAVGDYVTYNGVFYECVVAKTSASAVTPDNDIYNASTAATNHWTVTNVAMILGNIATALNVINNGAQQ